MRTYESGATRDDVSHKIQYEGFLHPLVLRAYGLYMHMHRVQSDGSLRASDNWQRGIPVRDYMDSLVRHVIDLWLVHREIFPAGLQAHELPVLEAAPREKLRALVELLCAVMFNTQGYLFTLCSELGAHELLPQPEATEIRRRPAVAGGASIDGEHMGDGHGPTIPCR